KLLEVGFRLEAAAPPPGQLVQQVPGELLELVERLEIGTFIVVGHAHPSRGSPCSLRRTPVSRSSSCRRCTSARSISAASSVRSGARKVRRKVTLRVPGGTLPPLYALTICTDSSTVTPPLDSTRPSEPAETPSGTSR